MRQFQWHKQSVEGRCYVDDEYVILKFSVSDLFTNYFEKYVTFFPVFSVFVTRNFMAWLEKISLV